MSNMNFSIPGSRELIKLLVKCFQMSHYLPIFLHSTLNDPNFENYLNIASQFEKFIFHMYPPMYIGITIK